MTSSWAIELASVRPHVLLSRKMFVYKIIVRKVIVRNPFKLDRYILRVNTVPRVYSLFVNFVWNVHFRLTIRWKIISQKFNFWSLDHSTCTAIGLCAEFWSDHYFKRNEFLDNLQLSETPPNMSTRNRRSRSLSTFSASTFWTRLHPFLTLKMWKMCSRVTKCSDNVRVQTSCLIVQQTGVHTGWYASFLTEIYVFLTNRRKHK